MLAGIGLMIDGNWPWGRLWVDFALLAFAGSFLVGIGFLAPTAKRIPAASPPRTPCSSQPTYVASCCASGPGSSMQ